MEGVIVVLVVALALGFDFTNGFHDAANAIATSVSTRALTPRVALVMAACMNFAGALIGVEQAGEPRFFIGRDVETAEADGDGRHPHPSHSPSARGPLPSPKERGRERRCVSGDAEG